MHNSSWAWTRKSTIHRDKWRDASCGTHRDRPSSDSLGRGYFAGDAKPFRSARQALGIKPFQQPGRKGGGWIWVLPGQAPIHRKPEGGHRQAPSAASGAPAAAPTQGGIIRGAIATAARSLGSKDTVTAFLLAVLADGPLRAREI